ncbi:MAG: hypothetical protein G01um101425_969 [Candidatus Peregrinibacteria bacterium Gr01-1014_25]|nr:MAG: hypothetical protein G01um101425_969 [Candidatus Peregrinibacteria bacterium Gr01-1014_25]
MELATNGRFALRLNQYGIAIGIGDAECQNFGKMLADLPGRKIDHTKNKAADELWAGIERRQSGKGLFCSDFCAEINIQNMR